MAGRCRFGAGRCRFAGGSCRLGGGDAAAWPALEGRGPPLDDIPKLTRHTCTRATHVYKRQPRSVTRKNATCKREANLQEAWQTCTREAESCIRQLQAFILEGHFAFSRP